MDKSRLNKQMRIGNIKSMVSEGGGDWDVLWCSRFQSEKKQKVIPYGLVRCITTPFSCLFVTFLVFRLNSANSCLLFLRYSPVSHIPRVWILAPERGKPSSNPISTQPFSALKLIPNAKKFDEFWTVSSDSFFINLKISQFS